MQYHQPRIILRTVVVLSLLELCEEGKSEIMVEDLADKTGFSIDQVAICMLDIGYAFPITAFLTNDSFGYIIEKPEYAQIIQMLRQCFQNSSWNPIEPFD